MSFFAPHNIPEQLIRYNSEPKQLKVGMAGKRGYLGITLKDAGERTVISAQRAEAPFCAQRAIYWEEALPQMVFYIISSSSGGILQGDRNRIDITAKSRTMAHITTQGATRVYGMDANCAMQTLNVTLEAESYLEVMPDQIIPYSGSRFYQETNLSVDESATLVYSEVVTPGRTAMGELFKYDVCYMRTRASRPDGRPVLYDVANMEPQKGRLNETGVLGPHHIMGTVYILDADNADDLCKSVQYMMRESKSVYGGVSMLHEKAGITARILGNDTEKVREHIERIIDMVRRSHTGAPYLALSKG